MTNKKPVRKMLMVSWPILPGRGGSVIIVEKLINYFTPDELVLFGELTPFGRAPERSADKPQAHYFRSGFSLFGRGARFFAWFRWLLFSILVNRIVRVAQKEKCDYILGVFPDEYYCYAACLAAKRLGIGFSTYFHNTYLDNQAVDQKRARVIQPVLFKSSEIVFVMSDGMKAFFEKQYQLHRVVPLVHTFDTFPTDNRNPHRSSEASDKTSLVLLGNFNASNMEATIRFASAVSRDPRFEIFLYTHVPPALLRMRGLDTNHIRHMGYVADDKIVAEIQKYDIAVLTHGFCGAYGDVEYQTIFPTRTIPMLLSGRPIFVHAPNGTFLADFMARTKAGWLVTEPTEAAVMQGLDKIATNPDLARQLVANAAATAPLFYGPKVADVLRTSLQMNAVHQHSATNAG